MIKIVNVKPVLPIMALRTPIMGEVLNCKLSDGDILQCIYSRAFVDEVLEDGTLVRLNLSNYNKDNSHLMKNKVIKEEVNVKTVTKAHMEEIIVEPVVEEVKVEEPVIEEVVEPVVETQQIEETVTEAPVEEVTEEPVVEEQQKDRRNNKKNRR